MYYIPFLLLLLLLLLLLFLLFLLLLLLLFLLLLLLLLLLRILGGAGSLRLPPWGGEHGSCLMDYVPLVHRLLSEKVEAIVQSYVMRKEYVAALLSVCGRSVLEYDTEGFKKVAFLFEHQGFSFVAYCELCSSCYESFVYVSLSLGLRTGACDCILGIM